MSMVCELLAPEMYSAPCPDVFAYYLEKPQRKEAIAKATQNLPKPRMVKKLTSRKDLTMQGYATFLSENYGWKVGRNKLFSFFREIGVFDGRKPKSDYLSNGFFVYTTKDTQSYAGEVCIPKITPAGQSYFFELVSSEFAGDSTKGGEVA